MVKTPYEMPGEKRRVAISRSVKQFKARIENPWDGCHSIIIRFQAGNIIEAGNNLIDKFAAFSVTPDQITQLIEDDRDHAHE